MPRDLWTVGHSTRSIEEFEGLLRPSGIGLVADVRRFPGSKRYPHFDQDALRRSLAAIGIGYRHFEGLGGRRGKRRADSPNTAWRVDAFNAFADHMESAEFQDALAELAREAEDRNVVVMCSEAVPWRCHRRIIADAMTARGWTVLDIISPTKADRHALTPFARVDGGRVTYPSTPLFDGGETDPA